MTTLTKNHTDITHTTANFLNQPVGAALTGFFLQFSAISTYLLHHGYPLMTLEVGLLILIIATISAVMGFIYNGVSQFSRNILIILLAAFAIDLFSESGWVIFIAVFIYIIAKDKTIFLVAMMSIIIIITKPLQYFIDENAAVQFPRISTINTEPRHTVETESNKPFILHLILDAHIGREGLGSLNVNTQKIKNRMDGFYSDNGFSVFGGAYSRYFHTVNSMPYIFNFGQEREPKHSGTSGIVMKENQYFDYLSENGYNFKILQSTWVDYCSTVTIEQCSTYPVVGPAALSQADLPVNQKTLKMLVDYINTSQILFYASLVPIVAAYSYEPSPYFLTVLQASSTASLSGEIALSDLSDLVRQAQPGEIYLAHILLPHSPYAYTKNCELAAVGTWKKRHDSISKQNEVEDAYLEQMGCGYQYVEKILQNIESSAAKDNNIIIIHGDHGSRITQLDPNITNVGQFSDRDMITSFSTLFAVRYQTREASYHSNVISIDKLFKNLVSNDLRDISVEDIHETSPTIMLENEQWTPLQEHALPPVWPINE